MDGRYMNGVYHDDDEIPTAWTNSLARSGGGSTERSGETADRWRNVRRGRRFHVSLPLACSIGFACGPIRF